MPVVQPSCGGFTGTAHGVDFVLDAFGAGVALPPRALAITAIDLMADEAAELRRIRDAAAPHLTKDTYLASLRDLAYEAAIDPA